MSARWTEAELIRAGWRDCDLEWEEAVLKLTERAMEEDLDGAAQAAAQALRIARESFCSGDPRLGTALANQAQSLFVRGESEPARTLLREARAHWAECDPWVERMSAPRVARSSMFHMRMEQIHRDTYTDRWREIWRSLVQEARVRIAALPYDDGAIPVSAHRAHERWRAESPAMLNDTRKLMAAVFFLGIPRVAKNNPPVKTPGGF